MSTLCKDDVFSCPLPGSDGKKQIGVDIGGGTLTSDGGVVLLGLADERLDLIPRLAGCFEDFRSPLLTVHPVEALVRQRLLALARGREDLNDHDRLRQDPAIGAVLGKTEPARSDCAPLAAKSTLNRLELSAAGAVPSKHWKTAASTARTRSTTLRPSPIFLITAASRLRSSRCRWRCASDPLPRIRRRSTRASPWSGRDGRSPTCTASASSSSCTIP